MKHRILKVGPAAIVSAIVFLVVSATPALHPQAATSIVTAKVAGARNSDGNLRIALRSAPETIMQGKTVDIDANTMATTVVFEAVPHGTYDIAVIHDENKNGQLDFAETGMPLEGYGFSNNPAKRPGPPNFDESKFTLDQPAKSLEVELIYWP